MKKKNLNNKTEINWDIIMHVASFIFEIDLTSAEHNQIYLFIYFFRVEERKTLNECNHSIDTYEPRYVV